MNDVEDCLIQPDDAAIQASENARPGEGARLILAQVGNRSESCVEPITVSCALHNEEFATTHEATASSVDLPTQADGEQDPEGDIRRPFLAPQLCRSFIAHNLASLTMCPE
jgi:hypothetical protein